MSLEPVRLKKYYHPGSYPQSIHCSPLSTVGTHILKVKTPGSCSVEHLDTHVLTLKLVYGQAAALMSCLWAGCTCPVPLADPVAWELRAASPQPLPSPFCQAHSTPAHPHPLGLYQHID